MNISKLMLTVRLFNTGLTDAELRKRYLMDLLAEKLKSSKSTSNFLLQTAEPLQHKETNISSSFLTSNVNVSDNGSIKRKGERKLFFSQSAFVVIS